MSGYDIFLMMLVKPFVFLVLLSPGVVALWWVKNRMKDGKLKQLLTKRL